jgi:hypothetical protein
MRTNEIWDEGMAVMTEIRDNPEMPLGIAVGKLTTVLGMLIEYHNLIIEQGGHLDPNAVVQGTARDIELLRNYWNGGDFFLFISNVAGRLPYDPNLFMPVLPEQLK